MFIGTFERNVNIKIYEPINLPVVLYGSETAL
jgi:hypothetical protein